MMSSEHEDLFSPEVIRNRCSLSKLVPQFESKGDPLSKVESVFCLQTANVLPYLGNNTGFIPADVIGESFASMIESPGRFIPRSICEEDPTTLQVIPYMMVLRTPENISCRGRDRKIPHIYSYLRNAKTGERRLHSSRSIGLGGHINPVDTGTQQENVPQLRNADLILNAAYRELEEEVAVRPLVLSSQMNFRGVIYDPSNLVGQVHLGVVFKIVLRNFQELTGSDVGHYENDFMPIDIWDERMEEFENWSKLIFPELFH